MASILPRNAGYVCRACRLQQNSTTTLSRLALLPDPPTTTQQLITQRHHARPVSTKNSISSARTAKIPSNSSVSRQPSSRPAVAQSQSQRPQTAPQTTSEVPINTEDVQGTLHEIQTDVNAICASNSLPDEVAILEVMDKAYQFANILVFGQTTSPEEEIASTDEAAEEERSDASMFSELEEPSQVTKDQASPPQSSTSATSPIPNNANSLPMSYRERSARLLSEAIYTLLKDPKVTISEPLLSTYVRVICQLGNPEYLPEIFFLYAYKPQAIPNSNPIQYRDPSPSSSKNAIPQALSDVALDTAILQRDLALAVAVIDTTVATRAFRRNKFLKKASLPLALVGSTPLAAYAAADWVSHWQNSLDPNMAKAVTLMGSAAYLGTLTTIGFVAVTTWNDHHERVRWTEGTPLRYRWMREEERLYFDRIAMAWGFQKRRRRGEEMGRLWEELREECGLRSMVLDKTELLPGMQ